MIIFLWSILIFFLFNNGLRNIFFFLHIGLIPSKNCRKIVVISVRNAWKFFTYFRSKIVGNFNLIPSEIRLMFCPIYQKFRFQSPRENRLIYFWDKILFCNAVFSDDNLSVRNHNFVRIPWEMSANSVSNTSEVSSQNAILFSSLQPKFKTMQRTVTLDGEVFSIGA